MGSRFILMPEALTLMPEDIASQLRSELDMVGKASKETIGVLREQIEQLTKEALVISKECEHYSEHYGSTDEDAANSTKSPAIDLGFHDNL